MLKLPTLIALAAAACFSAPAQTASDDSWPNYGGDPGGTRYSTAKQIDRTNVAKLQLAWTYRTSALPHDEDLDKAAFEATPILLDRKLFLSTPYDHVIALDAVSGKKNLGI
jgi:quinoprotein glucose dehydrogenase